MGKNSFKLIFFTSLICLYLIIFASFSLAAILRWEPVQSTESIVIGGYNVYYRTEQGSYVLAERLGNSTSFDLSQLNLPPAQTYYIAVSAYSTTGVEGELSAAIPYTESPSIVVHPVINYTNNTIAVTYSENNMQGADVKSNYSFFPVPLVFDTDYLIDQENRTYRLHLDYIPEHTIITMEVSNVVDSIGYSLISSQIILNDNDDNKMADDWEIFYGTTGAFSDDDSDGLENYLEFFSGTSPIDNDSDDDGMDDGWEFENDLDPVLNDADGDKDGDGISNLQEYKDGTGVSNSGPDKPVLAEPGNSSGNVSLTPLLKTGQYADRENDVHTRTQWQISLEQTFTVPGSLVFELETYSNLTSLTVPEFILDPDQTYYWRVRFFDVLNGRSFWSDSFSFTTTALNVEDTDSDGVPDNLEIVDGVVDLDADGSFDMTSNRYKLVLYDSLSIGLEGANNVSSVICLKTINPDDISDSYGKPSDLDYGLIQFKIGVNNPGDAADIIIYFSEPVGKKWFKYDLINGWSEYSKDYPGYVQFRPDGKSVRLRLIDGGAGDSDGVANGIIVDPSGPGNIVAAVSGSSVSASSGGGDGGGGCFIATAAFGSPVEKHVQVLKDFRDEYLLKLRMGRAFVSAYYKYSPPIADIISESEGLKAIVRVSLMPLIAFGYALLYLSPIQQGIVMFFGCTFVAIIWAGRKYFRFLTFSFRVQ